MAKMNPLASRLIVAAFAANPFVAVATRAQGGDVVLDFKMTQSGERMGAQTTGSSTGHATISKGRIRLDMEGTNLPMNPMPGRGGTKLSVIMQDTGKSMIFLMPDTKEYLRFNPAEMLEGASKMMESMGGTMAFKFSDDPKLEDLGAGPEILGHKTHHYRLTTKATMNIQMMGQSQGMTMTQVSDQYVDPDYKVADPFRRMREGGPGMFGQNKEFMDKLRAMYAKLPASPALRGEIQTTVEGGMASANIHTVQEITAIHSTHVSDDVFAVPSDYKQVQMPQMGGMGRPPGE